MGQVWIQRFWISSRSVEFVGSAPSGASSNSLTCAATGKTDMISAVAVSVVSETSSLHCIVSAGLAHACDIDLSDEDKRREEERRVVIWVAEVKRSLYLVLIISSFDKKWVCKSHPTIDLNSDCLFKASVLIFCSTLLTSCTGSLRKTSSGSTSAQSTSICFELGFFFAWYRRRLVSGVDKPEEWTDDSARVGRRSESVLVCLLEEEGSWEFSEEKDVVRGRWLVLALGVERADILVVGVLY